MFEAAAILLYGMLAYIAAIVVAVLSHSVAGASLIFASAGLTYIFQLWEVMDPTSRYLNALMVLAIVTLPVAVLVMLMGY